MQKVTIEKNLNPQQKQAVKYGFGPLLIIAGAGTGKTTVITERIKHLITNGMAKPQEVLALTFTEKASREMETRVDEAMPYGYSQMWISTFHSFCDRILRNEAIHIGLNPGYRLISETDSTMLLRKYLFELNLDYFRPLGNPGKFISGMLQHFGRLQDEDITPTQYLDWIKSKIRPEDDQPLAEKINPSTLLRIVNTRLSEEELLDMKKYQELSHAYKFYSELKTKENLMDFGDLITNTLVLFRSRKNILRQYQKQFKFILVDEFQDTNIAQYELIKLLAPADVPAGGSNLTVVGDDNQSIYKFRGAAISNILNFKKDYPKARQVVLNKNYRSFQFILDSAYRLIKHNDPDTLEAKLGISKELKAVRKTDNQEKVEFIHTDRVENEAEKVVKKIKDLVISSVSERSSEAQTSTSRRMSGLDFSSSSDWNRNDNQQYSWKDFAILIRANNHAEPFIRALSRHGIPYQFLGPGQLYRQPEIKELIAYLQVLNDFTDDPALYKVLSMEYFGISARDLVALVGFGKRNLLSLFETCEIVSGKLKKYPKKNLPYISDSTIENITSITEMILRHLELVKKESAGQILFYFLENSGILKNILEFKFPVDERQANNITKFFNKLKTYEAEHEDATVSAVLDFILMSMELGESPIAADTDWTDNNAVNILTVHSSKGLEFGTVFLVNLVSRRFPTTEKREQIPIPEELIREVLPVGDFHEEEERRLFYVGMTRAKDRLYLTAANYYGEGKREKKLSPFISEALDKNFKPTDTQSDINQLSLLDWQNKEVKQPVISTKININFLSYSQIETFKTCPLHYKLKYILKISTSPSPALSFGITMHAVLKEIYQMVRQGTAINQKLIYEQLDKNWISSGYKSKQYELLMKKRGESYLKGFLEKEFNPDTKILLLEENFMFPIITSDVIPAKAGILRNKIPDQVGDDKRVLKIGGKIDRVDDLGNGTIEIIDYKTGRVPGKREIDRDLQMSIYALAATEIPYSPFAKKPENIRLSFYYFDTQEKISTTRTREQLEEEKINLYRIAEDIGNSDYKCSGGKFCENCEYNLWCGID